MSYLHFLRKQGQGIGTIYSNTEDAAIFQAIGTLDQVYSSLIRLAPGNHSRSRRPAAVVLSSFPRYQALTLHSYGGYQKQVRILDSVGCANKTDRIRNALLKFVMLFVGHWYPVKGIAETAA